MISNAIGGKHLIDIWVNYFQMEAILYMLIGFDKQQIKIKKEGIRYPVDVTLSEINGMNILQITVRVFFLLPDYYETEFSIEKLNLWKSNILIGFQCWQGEYKVFGNQPIKVIVSVEEVNSPVDAVIVSTIQDKLQRKLSYLDKEKRKKWMNRYLGMRRDFASIGKKWSVTSRKVIFFRDSSIKSPGNITNIAKHEFGHCLGLGDMYRDPASGFLGIRKPDYKELRSFYMQDYQYNLVMCNNGAVSDNDIEMVILAFSENRMQHYQKSMFDKEQTISRALGRGN